MRLLPAVAAGVLALAVVPGSVAGSAAANAAPESQQVAAGTAGDFRVVVTATKGTDDGSGMPPATISIEGFEKEKGGDWQSVGTQAVGDQWFWNVVTDLGGVCDFSVADVPEATTTIKVNLSQSAECGTEETFQVDNGKLVQG